VGLFRHIVQTQCRSAIGSRRPHEENKFDTLGTALGVAPLAPSPWHRRVDGPGPLRRRPRSSLPESLEESPRHVLFFGEFRVR
jgi:hypothetical protein